MKQLLLLFIGCCLLACHRNGHNTQASSDNDSTEIMAIRQRGELTVWTLNDPTSYFVYRGQNMGYQYDLAKELARSLGVKLRLKIAKDEDDMIRRLCNNEGDLIAYNLTITNERKKQVAFCDEEHINYQVIVQKSGKQMALRATDLIGKDVYAYPGKHMDRLQSLNKELGEGIRIHRLRKDSLTMENAMEQVAKGKIPFLLSDKDYALVNQTYLSGLNSDLEITFGQRTAWAVRTDSPQLLRFINEWHNRKTSKATVKSGIQRYFRMNKGIIHSPIYSIQDGQISPFDDLFRKYASEIGWDWQLLASLAYAESNFNPNVVSWAGAVGLMQLMPATARNMGVPAGQEKDPEQSIKASVRYIARLQRIFRNVTPVSEQSKFVLASYNSGEGHILDAMALAEKYGKNKYLWDHHVAEFILLKSQPEYYQDPVCKNGYFRGTVTYNFVYDIINRAEYYRTKVK